MIRSAIATSVSVMAAMPVLTSDYMRSAGCSAGVPRRVARMRAANLLIDGLTHGSGQGHGCLFASLPISIRALAAGTIVIRRDNLSCWKSAVPAGRSMARPARDRRPVLSRTSPARPAASPPARVSAAGERMGASRRSVSIRASDSLRCQRRRLREKRSADTAGLGCGGRLSVL